MDKNDKLNLQIAKAYGYYLKGLTAKEIGKLLDVNARTVQRWQSDHHFKTKAKPLPMYERATLLRSQGLTIENIAKTLKVSRTTVCTYLRRAKENLQD